MKLFSKKPKRESKTITIKVRTMIVIAIALTLLLIGGIYAGYRYVEKTNKENFIDGGKMALTEIINSIQEVGGVVLEKEDNTTITIAKYNKE